MCNQKFFTKLKPGSSVIINTVTCSAWHHCYLHRNAGGCHWIFNWMAIHFRENLIRSDIVNNGKWVSKSLPVRARVWRFKSRSFQEMYCFNAFGYEICKFAVFEFVVNYILDKVYIISINKSLKYCCMNIFNYFPNSAWLF